MSLPEPILYAHRLIKSHIVHNGTGTWITRHESLPPDYLSQHLEGKTLYGVPLVAQQYVMTAMLDLDDHDGQTGWDNILIITDKMLNALSNIGLIGHPFRSRGGKGVNIWIIWDNEQQSASVRATLHELVKSLGYTPGSGGVIKQQIEIFPKQDSVTIDSDEVGSHVALPRTPLDPLILQDINFDSVIWSSSKSVSTIVKSPEVQIVSEKLTPEVLEELLTYVPNDDCEYDTWWGVILAIHDAGGTLKQAEAWSAKSKKHVTGYLPKKWRSIRGKDNTDKKFTVRTLKKMASDAGWTGTLVNVEAFPVPEDSRGADPDDTDHLVVPEYRRVPGKGRYAGHVVANKQQIIVCMQKDPTFPWCIAFDEFTQEIVLAPRDGGEWHRLKDHHYYQMGVWFDIKRWEPIHTTLIREAVNATAQANAINVAKTWAESLVWDGMDRYADALKHMCVEANDYTMAVMHYWWSAHGARILCPGYKCDSIIVLVGEQSTGKTMLIDTLAPKIGELRTYRDCNIEQLLHDDKSARIVRGALVLNLDELRYFSRREQAEIKATLSRTHESFVPKYIEFRNEFGRMCIIYATTNNYEFLDDETGNRRYHALVVRGEINLEWFRTHGEQLWAQGVHEFKTSGLSWQNAARFAPNQLIEHEMSDVWEDVIIDYLETIVTENVTTSEILELACKMPINQQDRKSQMRVAKILISIGWEKKIIWRNNSTTRVWQRKLNQW